MPSLQTLLSALRKCEREYGDHGGLLGCHCQLCERNYRLAQKLEARIMGMFAQEYERGLAEGIMEGFERSEINHYEEK